MSAAAHADAVVHTALLAAQTCTPAHLSDWRNLLAVIGDFLSLSLFSLGGGNTLLSEYHLLAVDKYCWLTSRQFADIYAIAEVGGRAALGSQKQCVHRCRGQYQAIASGPAISTKGIRRT